MGFAVDVQHRCLGILAESPCPRLMRHPSHRNVILQVGFSGYEVVRMHTEVVEHRFQLFVQFLRRDLVVGGITQGHLSIATDGDSIVRFREILGR